MPKMIVRHKVKDFDTWKKVFDSHKGAQTAAGLTNPRIFRSADDPNETVVIFDAQDIARAKAFGASADLKSTMVASGLVDKPDTSISTIERLTLLELSSHLSGGSQFPLSGVKRTSLALVLMSANDRTATFAMHCGNDLMRPCSLWVGILLFRCLLY